MPGRCEYGCIDSVYRCNVVAPQYDGESHRWAHGQYPGRPQEPSTRSAADPVSWSWQTEPAMTVGGSSGALMRAGLGRSIFESSGRRLVGALTV
jgi:hypothetical protein